MSLIESPSHSSSSEAPTAASRSAEKTQAPCPTLIDPPPADLQRFQTAEGIHCVLSSRWQSYEIEHAPGNRMIISILYGRRIAIIELLEHQQALPEAEKAIEVFEQRQVHQP
jgi:hypothetical protein